jgi:hypothetical protein
MEGSEAFVKYAITNSRNKNSIVSVQENMYLLREREREGSRAVQKIKILDSIILLEDVSWRHK